MPGPGTELSKLLARFGIRSKPGCGCRRHADEMDRRGPVWCERNIDLIAGWLMVEARKRKLPALRSAAKVLIRRAIANSRRLTEQVR